MSSFFKLDSLTREQRQLRQNIRNCYMVATLGELKKELSYRTSKGANSFELECFRQLIREALNEV